MATNTIFEEKYKEDMEDEPEVESDWDWKKDPELMALLVEGVPRILKKVDKDGEEIPDKKYAYVPAGNGSWGNLMKVDPCGHQTMA